MKLHVRLLIGALLVAIPAAAAIFLLNERKRERDMRLALDRFVTSQLTDDTREKCDANANWFLAGPRPNKPSREVLSRPDAELTAPRPPAQELPFDFFAYSGGDYQPLSVAGPRFPTEFRNAMRDGAEKVVGRFQTKDGVGQQQAVATGWRGSPCAVLLFRMWPVPNQLGERVTMALSLAGVLLLVGLVPGLPLIARARRLGVEARRAAAEEYKSSIDVGGKDEMSSIAFAFNEAAADIRQRTTDIRDREDSLRRYISSVTDSVTQRVAALEDRLALIDRLSPPPVRAEVNAAVADAHALSMRLQNLAVAASLKTSLASPSRDAVDLPALVQRVVDRQAAFARASGVCIDARTEGGPITIAGNVELVEQAVNNLVDNAIRHNREGGRVSISLDRIRDGRFSLRIADDGQGASDEVIAKLNAIHRFRGDEGKAGRSGELGLGLAIVREICDRLGIAWAFRRSAQGGFEAELSGRTS